MFENISVSIAPAWLDYNVWSKVLYVDAFVDSNIGEDMTEL